MVRVGSGGAPGADGQRIDLEPTSQAAEQLETEGHTTERPKPRTDRPETERPTTERPTTDAPARAPIDLSGGTPPSARSAEGLARPAPRGLGVEGSILNRGGGGNPDAVSPALRQLLPGAGGDDRVARVDPRSHVADPDAVSTRPTGAGVEPRIREILLTHEGEPRTGELLAQTLAELLGPYDLVPGESREAAYARLERIDAHLAWIEATLVYEHARADSAATDTYAPNQTLSRNGGVCRDIHLATTAILASLMNARLAGGVWRAGSPAGREDRAQTLGFETPTEAHAFRTWRHPLTGRWRASEYGKRYAVDGPTSVDAFASVVGGIAGYTRYTLRGWDEHPAVNDRGVVSAARASGFFERNPGTGRAGEVRAAGGASSAGATLFFTPHLSLSGELDPGALHDGFRGGLKLDYHRELRSLDPRGYVHAAGGVYADSYDASSGTGVRGAAARVRYRVYVFALQVDGRYQGDPLALLGEHLRLGWGADWNLRLGVPLGLGGGSDPHLMPLGAGDYSAGDLGADLGLTGSETLGERLRLDWALRARGRVDVVNLGTEVISSSGGAPSRSALVDPWRTAFAISLRHEGPSVTTRFEIGGTQLLAPPYDGQTTPRETHYAALSVGARSLSFGIVGKGETVAGDFVPLDALGLALALEPSPRVSLGVGAQSVFPRGDVRRAGERLQVTGAATLRF